MIKAVPIPSGTVPTILILMMTSWWYLGDNLIDINLQKFMEFHRSRDPVLTVALKKLAPGEDISQYGVADIDENYRIRGFVEKPKAGNEPSRMINTAFYLFSPKIRGILQGIGDVPGILEGTSYLT